MYHQWLHVLKVNLFHLDLPATIHQCETSASNEQDTKRGEDTDDSESTPGLVYRLAWWRGHATKEDTSNFGG